MNYSQIEAYKSKKKKEEYKEFIDGIRKDGRVRRSEAFALVEREFGVSLSKAIAVVDEYIDKVLTNK